MATKIDLTGEFDIGEVLEEMAIKDIVYYLGASDLLEEIGEQEARDYFGIEEN